MSANQRLETLRSHVTSRFPPLLYDPSLDLFRSRTPALDSVQFSEIYFSPYCSRLERVRSALLALPSFVPQQNFTLSRTELRKLTVQRLSEGFFSLNSNYKTDQKDPLNKLITPYAFSEFEMGQVTMSLIQSVLYIDSLQELGTQKHKEFIEKAYSLEHFGSFAMTELGHGSDVAKLETTATYDPRTHKFTLNSPTATSAKWWVGGLAKNATHTVLTAKLIVQGIDRGVHMFIVRVRDLAHDVFPGITIGDCGHKVELNGVDNGFLLFCQYKVPYSSLLDKFAQVTMDGEYKSSIKNKEKRLGTQMAGLIRGRICVMYGSESNLRAGLTVAIRYCAVRTQFGDPEIPLLDYPLVRYLLVPLLGKQFAIMFCTAQILHEYQRIQNIIKEDPDSEEVAEYHAILSAGKAMASWYSVKGLQVIRECLGGHGYSSHASIGRLRAGQDIHTTWEGSNTVLLQQTSKFLLKQLQKLFRGNKNSASSLQFLQSDRGEVMKYKPVFSTEEELLNEELLIELLEYRVNYLLHQSAAKLQENVESAPSMLNAWNRTQPFYLQNLSLAYIEVVAAKRFLARIHSFPGSGVIRKLFYLYAVNLIEENLVVFLENCLSGAQAKVVRECLMGTVNAVADVSVRVFDVIGVEDQFLGSCLGNRDGQVYREIIRRVESDPTCYEKAGWTDLLKGLSGRVISRSEVK